MVPFPIGWPELLNIYISFVLSGGLGFLAGFVKRVVPSRNLEQKVKHSSAIYPSAIEPSG
jgi:hypothetical protein